MVNADDNITKSSAYSALFVALRHGWSPSPQLVAFPFVGQATKKGEIIQTICLNGS